MVGLDYAGFGLKQSVTRADRHPTDGSDRPAEHIIARLESKAGLGLAQNVELRCNLARAVEDRIRHHEGRGRAVGSAGRLAASHLANFGRDVQCQGKEPDEVNSTLAACLQHIDIDVGNTNHISPILDSQATVPLKQVAYCAEAVAVCIEAVEHAEVFTL